MAETRSPAHLAYGRALREFRSTLGISQERLADMAGLDRTYVSGIERGERNPSLTNLLRITQTLGVRLQDVAVRADAIADGTPATPPQTSERQRVYERHPVSLGLERAAIALKGVNRETMPITLDDARDILQDASRVIAEVAETLLFYEEQTRQNTGVITELGNVFDKLDNEWQKFPPADR